MLTPPLRHTHRIDPARLPAQWISAATHRVAWEPPLVTDRSSPAPGGGSLTPQRTLDLRAVERPLPWATVDAGRPSVHVRSSARGRSTSRSDGTAPQAPNIVPLAAAIPTISRLNSVASSSGSLGAAEAAFLRCGDSLSQSGQLHPSDRHRLGGFLAADATMELGDAFPRCH
jgi:hypothetical protein